MVFWVLAIGFANLLQPRVDAERTGREQRGRTDVGDGGDTGRTGLDDSREIGRTGNKAL